jgi:hypothetical protein
LILSGKKRLTDGKIGHGKARKAIQRRITDVYPHIYPYGYSVRPDRRPDFPLTDPGEPLKALCETDRENLEAGRAFSVTLVFNYDKTREVTVIPRISETNSASKISTRPCASSVKQRAIPKADWYLHSFP